MRDFPGFPQKMRFTPIPNMFFSELMPHIEDISELKVTLYIFWTLYHRRGYPRFITLSELLSDATLISSLKGEQPPDAMLRHGLELAMSRGTLLHLKLERNGEGDDIYLINNDEGRGIVAKLESGELKLGGRLRREQASPEERPNIFAFYEQNIGLLTPLIAEELKEAERFYPAPWIEDAFREAVRHNKRSWRYISSILQRWAVEGRSYGELGRDSKAHTAATGRSEGYRYPKRRSR
jgi:DnaD/phage-associated family protein